MNNSISLQQAIDMTKLCRSQKGNIIKPEYAGQNLILISETFDRAIFDAILGETGCVKMRIYNGMNADLQLKAIIVGVNDQDQDILPSSLTLSDEEIYIGEEGQSCPPICAPPSPLNP